MSASRQVGAERSCGVRDGSSADNGWYRHSAPANAVASERRSTEKATVLSVSRVGLFRSSYGPEMGFAFDISPFLACSQGTPV